MPIKPFTLICIFLIAGLYSQELPPIQNFKPVDYGAQNQNWGITQSDQKNIYVANNSGLLEYNGAVWKLYHSPNGSIIRSVKAVNDKIFTGSYMDFGFWKKNVYGDFIYQSLSARLEAPLIEEEEFWNIRHMDDWILFQSLERIYLYNTTSDTINLLEAKSSAAKLFTVNGNIYFQRIDEGLFKIEQGSPVLVSDAKEIKRSVVAGMFVADNNILIVSEKGDFYFLKDGKLTKANDPLLSQTSSISIYSSLQLANGDIALGTISDGIYLISPQGDTLVKVNQEKGLNNNTVLSIFQDADHNLWLALDNGISAINLDSPFNEYIDKNGKLGVVYTATLFDDKLYLGTNQGLFYKQTGSRLEFSLISGTEGQVWLLKIIDGTLFCGHNNGTYVIEQDRAQLISDFPGTWDLKPVPNNTNLILQGNYNGLSVLEKQGNRWNLRNTVEGFDISSRFFEFLGEKQVAVNREFKGIYKLDLNADLTQVVRISNEPSKGIGASLVHYLGDVLYACDSGIYKFNESQELFVRDSLMSNVFYTDNDPPVGIFIADTNNERLWCFTGSSVAFATRGQFNSKPVLRKIPITSDLRRNLGVLGFESLTPIGDEKYLIGISNGYLTLDLTKLTSREHSININAVSKRTKDTDFSRIPLDSVLNLEYNESNLSFTYNVAEFDKYSEVNFQYQLAGLYENWSNWTSTPTVSFENLPYGEYNFKVRARVGNNLTTNIASYEFKIERPWYLSNLAILFYVLGVLLFALVVHRLYRAYYRKQQEQLLKANKKKLKRKQLKAQKKIVQIRNEKLQELVKSKNRELAISTMSIIKKNEFLNAIKDQLKGVADHQVKSVIRTIDRNINNEDDWKFFEDAFNNADKDFLKKVKNLHPELTANDLRLCAYLRLNLSSKEIAPLLNISVRSVEVKRYRLRKKINITRDEGLTEYIMKI